MPDNRGSTVTYFFEIMRPKNYACKTTVHKTNDAQSNGQNVPSGA